MDFAKSFVKADNVVTQSGIRMLPVPDIDKLSDSNKNELMKRKIQIMLIESANKAAAELLHSSGAKLFSTIKKRPRNSMDSNNDSIKKGTNEHLFLKEGDQHSLVDCRLYPTQVLPPSSKIIPSSLVVVFESFESLNFLYATPGHIFSNRNGHFHHDDFIGKPFGCKIRSRNNRGYGWVQLLKPTPELWARSLNHRTQIVHELDASIIIFHLNIKPNMVVCESGTGSGAMSHAILRAVAPFGKLHTYEFNEMRVKAARSEFESNGVDHLVTVHWRDVCGKSNEKAVYEDSKQQKEGEIMGSGGFGIEPSSAHAIFLDLPEPWLAIKYAAETLKPNGRLCSYSPCVEQSQKTVKEMQSCGFHSIRTLEIRLREHHVDDVKLRKVPTEKLPKGIINPYIPGASMALPEKNEDGKSDEQESCNKYKSTIEIPQPLQPSVDSSKDKKNLATIHAVSKHRKILCARPFPTMKGHTAFLTFATVGNKSMYSNSKQM